MYIKRDNVRIKRIISDLRHAIADLKKVVLFEYEMPLLSKVETCYSDKTKCCTSLLSSRIFLY